MTVTKDADCVDITITSTYFNVDNQLVELTVKTNCSEEYLISVSPSDTEIIVDVEALGLGDLEALPDGVYYFELNITQENGDKVTESSCVFLNCGLTCLMKDTFIAAAKGNDEAIIKSLAFHALIAAEGCNDCACSDLCLLFNTTQLVNCTSNVTTSCGCS